jgi:hypothetical protein
MLTDPSSVGQGKPTQTEFGSNSLSTTYWPTMNIKNKMENCIMIHVYKSVALYSSKYGK